MSSLCFFPHVLRSHLLSFDFSYEFECVIPPQSSHHDYDERKGQRRRMFHELVAHERLAVVGVVGEKKTADRHFATLRTTVEDFIDCVNIAFGMTQNVVRSLSY